MTQVGVIDWVKDVMGQTNWVKMNDYWVNLHLTQMLGRDDPVWGWWEFDPCVGSILGQKMTQLFLQCGPTQKQKNENRDGTVPTFH